MRVGDRSRTTRLARDLAQNLFTVGRFIEAIMAWKPELYVIGGVGGGVGTICRIRV